MPHRLDVRLAADNRLAQQEASREIKVVAGCPHGDAERLFSEADLERLLDGENVVGLDRIASVDSADSGRCGHRAIVAACRTIDVVRSLVLILSLFAAAPLFTADKTERAICAVCGPREGSGFEDVKARAAYRGASYAFCSLECKVEFLKNPEAFLRTDHGTPAPQFTLPALDGKPISLADLKGKVVLLDFWATFCPPCLAALPELEALHKSHAAEGLVVIGVSVDDRLPLVKKASAGVSYPIVQSTPEVWNAYKVNALPSLVLVGRDGKIVRRYGGEADKAAMLRDIRSALAAGG